MVVGGIRDGVDFWERMDKASKGQETSHHTLVIAEKTFDC
jgi:hypothetical protein